MSEFHPVTLINLPGKTFGKYLAEILIAEGLPYVHAAVETGSLTVERNPLIILPAGHIGSVGIKQALSLAGEGAVLISIRPAPDLQARLGLKPLGVLEEAYLSFPGSRPIQIHSASDIYDGGGWEILADLCNKGDETVGPGVMTSGFGSGRVTVITFDLPRSVVLTRQGNPAWVDSKGDEWLGGVRPGDLFCRLDGESWLDMGNAEIPQADILQRYLVDLIISQSGLPLPRTWYFPRMERTSVTIVADSDSATPRDVAVETELVRNHGGVYSLYLIDKTLELFTPAEMSVFLEACNEASIHPDYNRFGNPLSPSGERVRELYADMVGRFEDRYGTRPLTMRHHSIVWCGWADVPRIEMDFGISLDNNYGYPPWFGQERFGGPAVGYLTGSGQPQRFCDLDGEIIDVYQIEQNFEDEILLPRKGLDISGEEAARYLADFVEASLNGNYSHVIACFHPITVNSSPEAKRALEAFLSYCERNSHRLRTLREVAQFADTRRDMSFGRFLRDGDSLSFEVSGPPGVTRRGVTIIVPGNRVRHVETDADTSIWKRTDLWGREYLYATPERLPISVRIS